MDEPTETAPKPEESWQEFSRRTARNQQQTRVLLTEAIELLQNLRKQRESVSII